MALAFPISLLLCSLGGRFEHSQAQGDLQDTLKRFRKFGFGRTATAKEIAAWDIDIRPDGKGLPAGQGDVKKGRLLYAAKCAVCHGVNGTENARCKVTRNGFSRRYLGESQTQNDRQLLAVCHYAVRLHQALHAL